MGKFSPPAMPNIKQEKRPAPVTRESEAVKRAGQREIETAQKKQGRLSTFISDPAKRTGFAGLFNRKTGGV